MQASVEKPTGEGRRASLNIGSAFTSFSNGAGFSRDADDFLNNETLSAISAPLGHYPSHSSRRPSTIFGGAASVAGGTFSGPYGGGGGGGGSFLEKFSAIGERTKDLELSLGKLSIAGNNQKNNSSENIINSRRTSFLNGENSGFLHSPSISRHQSFSNNSPQQRRLSASSERDDSTSKNNIWNAGTANSFVPNLFDPSAGYFPQYGPMMGYPFSGAPPPLPGFSGFPVPDESAIDEEPETPFVPFNPPFNPYPMFGQAAPKEEEPKPSESRRSPGFKKENSKRNNKKFISRSPLLEDFRQNKSSRQFTLKSIVGHGAEFSHDQHGSRFIQQQLANSPEEDKQAVFNDIKDESFALMTDVFGNYVIQNYFEFGSPSQKATLLKSMEGSVKELSMQMYGCRVVQRAVEHVAYKDQLQIAIELQNCIYDLVKDQNGNHVVQVIIEKLPTESVPFIFESLKNHILPLSANAYGCRVIQRLLEKCNTPEKDFILRTLAQDYFHLIQDQFGNYVIQHILDHKELHQRESIIACVISNLVLFSKHKFASNVVEKCITLSDLPTRRKFYEEMLADNGSQTLSIGESSNLALMIKDPFANYVVQKMLCSMEDYQLKRELTIKIRQYLKQMSEKNVGSKHLASIEKLIALSEEVLPGQS